VACWKCAHACLPHLLLALPLRAQGLPLLIYSMLPRLQHSSLFGLLLLLLLLQASWEIYQAVHCSRFWQLLLLSWKAIQVSRAPQHRLIWPVLLLQRLPQQQRQLLILLLLLMVLLLLLMMMMMQLLQLLGMPACIHAVIIKQLHQPATS
jgi:hypothetical protein